MATKKKGVLAVSGEWWKHLRWTKRSFWKKNRRLERKALKSFREKLGA